MNFLACHPRYTSPHIRYLVKSPVLLAASPSGHRSAGSRRATAGVGKGAREERGDLRRFLDGEW